MGLCGWIIFGLLAGLVARAVTPGTQKMGFIATTLLGIGGAFVGGVIGSLIRGVPFWILRPSGFIGAVIGAIVLLVLGHALAKNKR